MRVECHIDPDCAESHAVLHIDQMTPLIAEVISLLEKEDAASAALIAVKDGKTYFLEPEKLELVRTEGREIACYDDQKNRYVLGRPLYELEQTLDPYFARISKSAIVNLRRISHVKAGLNGTMELVTKTGLKDYISRSFRKSFKERLGLK
ncbi:MAG: LytTR family transcriptional regulator [Lachnospiraceae bacterium]|nr:LytTR family transcriptional regulator [Lachnospiraceae bacterium]